MEPVADARTTSAPPRVGAELRVELVTTQEEMEALEGEWRALFARTPDPLPFRTHAWAAAWWRHLRRTARGPGRAYSVHDALRLYVVRDAQGEAVAFAPYMLTGYRLLGVSVCRILQPIGTDPNLTEVRGVLAAPEHEAAALAALAAHFARDASYDWLRYAGLPPAGGACQRLLSLPGARVDAPRSAFLLPLPESWERLRATRPRNLRESLRKCYNSLARDGLAWRFRAIEAADEVMESLDRFFELHARRAALAAGVPHRDNFAAAESRAFLREVVARFAPRGEALMFQLEIDGDVVAMRLGFLLEKNLYLYYSGYDPAWSRYSVMTTVLAEALRFAVGRGVATANLSTGADVSKTRWRPDESAYVDVLLVPPRPRSALAFRAFTAATSRTRRPAPADTPAAPDHDQ